MECTFIQTIWLSSHPSFLFTGTHLFMKYITRNTATSRYDVSRTSNWKSLIRYVDNRFFIIGSPFQAYLRQIRKNNLFFVILENWWGTREIITEEHGFQWSESNKLWCNEIRKVFLSVRNISHRGKLWLKGFIIYMHCSCISTDLWNWMTTLLYMGWG